MTLPVGDFSSSESNKEKTGKVFVVDPNPPGMEVIPPEDMFIYVKFSAYPRSRTTYGGTLEGDAVLFESGVEDEVNFISTKISYKDGKLDPNPQKTYATTDWTEIGGFKRSDTRSSGILEGFGIKNIDIKYNASLVPVVDVTFTDVRGSALFDVIESDDRKTPYSLFFKMPYPVFKLSVKGYYGQKVDYCLHMVNWTSNFDGSTGNFDISANFLGFQQAFLNDMVIGNVIGTVNTPIGRKNLDDIYNARNSDIPSDDGKDLRQLDDFLTKIAKIQIDSEIIKSDSNNFEVLKNLNGKLKLLKTIRNFVGAAIPKQPKENGSADKTQEEYLKRENKYNFFNTSSIRDDELIKNQNYLSIRDFVVFKSQNVQAFKTYIGTLIDIRKQYLEYLEGIVGDKFDPPESVSKLKEKERERLIGIQSGKKENYDEELIDSIIGSGDRENAWEKYIIYTLDVNGKPESKKLEDVIKVFISGVTDSNGNVVDNIPIKLTTNYDTGFDGVNTGINLDKFKKNALEQPLGQGEYYTNPYKFKKDTNVFVADFRKLRALTEDAIQKLEETIKVLRDIVQQELNDEILKNFKDQFQFLPTIDKCFEILANNTQAMVETIYDISKSAEEKGKNGDRKADLRGYETDIIDGATEVAWPSVYDIGTDNSLKEIYIGETNVDINNFPELSFVEEVYKIIVAKEKNLEDVTRSATLKNGLDTDNWFPINPLDYKINPWIRLNSSNDINSIGEELLKNIFIRVAVLKNYSNFNSNTGLANIGEYAKLEAIALNKTVISENTRSIIYNNSNGMLSGVLTDIQSQILNNTFVAEGKFNIRNSNFWKDFIIEDSGNFKIKEDNNPRFNEFLISGRFSDDVKYILFDDKNILNNSKKLFKEIREETTYRTKIIDQTIKNGTKEQSKFGESKGGGKFYLNKYVNNNLNTYNSYNVWDANIGSTILGTKSNRIENNLKGVPLSNFNPTGNTKNSKYINVSNFVSNSGCTFGDTLLETNLYKQNDKYARALMMLSTFPFRTFKEAFMDSVFPNGELSGARIVNLPNLYVYYLGGLLKRYDGEININFNVNSISGNCTYSEFETDKKQYLNIGYLRGLSGDTKIDLEQELVKLPKSVRKDLKFQFENWVDGDRFNDTLNGFFELNVNYMVPSINETTITPQNKKSGENYILGQLQKTTNMTILNPKIFDPNRDNKLLVIDFELSQYIDSLIEKFKSVEVENNKIPELTSSEDIKDATQEKLQIYNYFKNINLKWVGGDKKSFNICGGGKNALIDYFKFIDRGWRNIGSEATFNLKSFLTLGSNLDTSVYFFMSKLLRDSNFLFQILPTYINYKDASEVSKIFQPLTQLESNSESGPIFCCIYVGGASEVLDISERSNYYFKNDGYRFPNPNDPNDQGDLPPDMVSPDDSSLVAFRVAFGAQNQTVFKNVSLSQQEHKETGEYFRALTDLVDKRGGTQQTYVGTDLLRLFKTRSYTCKVDALGCMNIQPLMYFDLQNVPFFNGAYLITSVNHSISPNHMTTNFQGVRQSKFISPPTDKIVAELNLDLNESSEIPKIEFTNLDNKNPLYTIGVLNPTEPFDFDSNFTLEKFKLLGVNLPDEVIQNKINLFETILTSGSATTNSQVTTFMAAVLSNSNNLTNDEMSWEVENIENFKVTDSNNNNLFYGGVAGTVLVDNDPIIAEQSDSYLSSVPFFTAGTPEQRAYTPAGNEDLNEYLKNEDIERQKEDIKKKIGNTTDEKRKEELEIELKNLKEKEKNLIKTLPYYNIFKGDAWRFRPRGYLYIIGRKQYNDIGDVGTSLIDNPSLAKQFSEVISFEVWKKYKTQFRSLTEIAEGNPNDQTAYELSNIGTASSYARCIEICHQYKGPGLETAFNTFENVLTVFEDSNGESLIDFNNP